MKCLGLIGKQETCQFSYKNHLFYTFVIESLYLYLLCLSAALLCYTEFQNHSLIRFHIVFLLYLLLWFGFSTSKPAGFHQNM